ncbi:hypothetical protein VNO80_19341 [Phaseolus coccineus]|uniref:Uncharacterized protein n=1 Tax=Phaseolus coccineus TaxID=3886 RepID=A0AAN9MM14_PHACN
MDNLITSLSCNYAPTSTIGLLRNPHNYLPLKILVIFVTEHIMCSLITTAKPRSTGIVDRRGDRHYTTAYGKLKKREKT